MREIGVGLAVGVVLALSAFFVAARPIAGRPMAALFAPGSSSAAMTSAVARAGGSLLQIDPSSSSVVTIAESPGFARDLYAAGAWLVLDGSLAPLCAGLGGWRAT